MHDKIKNIIDKLNLQPHIEGGYYRQTYKSHITTHVNNKLRSANTAIYYLLEGEDFSGWHRLKSDEIWHYYCGSNLIIHQIDEKGALSSIVLGNIYEHPHIQPQCIIPAGTWFSAEIATAESFTLVGCTVAPGFEYDDFEIGKKTYLLNKYPQHEKIIRKFIRE